MDVAYRLCPETGAVGMVGDAKRAVAWMKAHAAEYGASPEKVVLMGASAGAHIALLTAYATNHPRLTPDDLREVDTSVPTSKQALERENATYELRPVGTN
jgi:acetyl esterase/lipase